MKCKLLYATVLIPMILSTACSGHKQQQADERQPVTETPKQENGTNAGKNMLHESLRAFKQLVFVLETSKFRIRIDDMGNDHYRYASWSINKDMSAKPDLVIENGEMTMEGTMGDKRYSFHNGAFTYECLTNTMGEEGSPPVILTISKGDKEIASQDAKIVGQ
jgi:hypothetical protein